jgi:hypothetical protein
MADSVPPFSHEQVKRAFDTVRALDAKRIEALVKQRLGTEMLGAFAALAKGVFPHAPERDLSAAVHLMVLACAMRDEAGGK